MDVLTISCDDCAMRATPTCDDCLVSFVCDGDERAGEVMLTGGVVLDLAEQRAVRMLASAGMVPTIRHRATG